MASLRVISGVSPTLECLPLFPQNHPLGKSSSNQQNSRTPGCRSRETFQKPTKGLAFGLWLLLVGISHTNISFNLRGTSTRSRLWSHFMEGKTEAVRDEETHPRFLSRAARSLLQAFESGACVQPLSTPKPGETSGNIPLPLFNINATTLCSVGWTTGPGDSQMSWVLLL